MFLNSTFCVQIFIVKVFQLSPPNFFDQEVPFELELLGRSQLNICFVRKNWFVESAPAFVEWDLFAQKSAFFRWPSSNQLSKNLDRVLPFRFVATTFIDIHWTRTGWRRPPGKFFPLVPCRERESVRVWERKKCAREREREKEREWVCGWEREKRCVWKRSTCVVERERERVKVCVNEINVCGWERERERERVKVCLWKRSTCVCEWERERKKMWRETVWKREGEEKWVSVCVCEREREKERKREREKEKYMTFCCFLYFRCIFVKLLQQGHNKTCNKGQFYKIMALAHKLV